MSSNTLAPSPRLSQRFPAAAFRLAGMFCLDPVASRLRRSRTILAVRASCFRRPGWHPGQRKHLFARLPAVHIAALMMMFLLSNLASRVALSQVSAEPDSIESQAQGAVDNQDANLTDNNTAADLELEAHIRSILGGFEQFSSVEVEAHGGVVRLTGIVPGISQREQVEGIVRALPAVVYVLSDVETSLAVDSRVTPAIQRARDYVANLFNYLPVIGVAVALLILFWVLAAVSGRIRFPFERLGVPPIISTLMARLVRFVVFVVGVVLALDVLGISSLVGAVLGTAGLVGIAIGFAFQDIIENYLAGLILSIRQPFGIGDYVKVNNDEGKVMRMTARELLLMTLDGNHVSIPNGHVFKNTVYNYTRNPRRRFTFDVGIDVAEDLAQVQTVGLATLRSLPGVMEDPAPLMQVKALGDSSVVVSWFGWVNQKEADFLKVRSEAIRQLKGALDREGIVMPEPIYNVRMQNVHSFTSPEAEEAKAKAGQRVAGAPDEVVDVSVERAIEEQIEEDIAASDEENLLAT